LSSRLQEADDTIDKAPLGAVKTVPQSDGALQLVPVFQTYAWGRPWETSLVARLCETQERTLNHGLSYAELWMGTHRNGPSSVRIEGPDGVGGHLEGLQETIKRRPQFWLGGDVQRGDLPFMLKVLSVDRAVSIQAHPDRQRAQFLHSEQPENYPDGNHKPEICLPLGDFEALVAFRPFEEVRKFVREVRELERIVGDKVQYDLKDLFSRLMRSDPKYVEQQASSLVSRLGRKNPETLSPEENLVIRLHQHYPGDVGIFSVFFLNYVRVTADQRRQFIFCEPNEPYCYLSGDCIECMSASDNAVRGGLTTKHKDVETFLDMMTYRDNLLGSLVGEGEAIGQRVVRYNPPVDDFMVYEVEGGQSGTSQPDPPIDLPHASICICIAGNFSVSFGSASSPVEEIRQGQSLFCRANTCLTVHCSEEGSRLFIGTY